MTKNRKWLWAILAVVLIAAVAFGAWYAATNIPEVRKLFGFGKKPGAGDNLPTQPTQVPLVTEAPAAELVSEAVPSVKLWLANDETLTGRPKSEEQLAFEAALGRELTTGDVVGFSGHGDRIGTRYANRLFFVDYDETVFRGLSGDFNTANEAWLTIQSDVDNYDVIMRAAKIMLNANPEDIRLAAQQEAETGLWQRLVWNHANACLSAKKRTAKLEYREMLDKLVNKEYQSLRTDTFRTHWVFRITRVTKEEYEAATPDFQGWHLGAAPGVYRSKSYADEAKNLFIVGEIFYDESEWATPVIHIPLGDVFTQGGFRINDLCIVVPYDPCTGNPSVNPTEVPVQPTATPAPTPTKEPKPSDEGEYMYTNPEKPNESAPVEAPNAEPTNVPTPKPTKKSAAPAQQPAQQPAPASQPEPAPAPLPEPAPAQVQVVVINNPPDNSAPYPSTTEPPQVNETSTEAVDLSGI